MHCEDYTNKEDDRYFIINNTYSNGLWLLSSLLTLYIHSVEIHLILL